MGTKRRKNVIVGLIGGALLALAAIGVVSAETSWLDQPPKAWNVAGAPIPKPPPTELAQQICTTKERSAANAEEALVAGAGWRLEGYWPIQRRGNLAVVMALSDYDGMCRPLGFNGFVFANGTYVGTISPVNLNSRTDGVLNRALTLPADGVIQAIFTRYAPTDPLCCASRPATDVTYGLINGVIAPTTIATESKSPSPAPSLPRTLPRSGSPLSWLLAIAAGLTLIVVGEHARRSKSS